MAMIDFAAFISGLSGVIIGAGIIVVWLRQMLSDYSNLKRKVEEQLEQRLTRVEHDHAEEQKQFTDLARRLKVAEGRLKPMNVPLLNQQIRTVSQQLDGVETKLDRYMEATARQDERIRSLHEHHEELQEMIRALGVGAGQRD